MSYENWRKSGSGHRLFLFGPSGSGTSTLGRVLASELATQEIDTDDFYWEPTDPPFTVKRPPAARRALMETVFLPRRDWVLSGSMSSWSAGIPERFTLAILLTLDPDLRRARLEAREAKRCSCGRSWGQPMCTRCTAFLCWADGYETGHRPGRSLSSHLTWAQTLPCPVLTLDSARPLTQLAHEVLDRLDQAESLT